MRDGIHGSKRGGRIRSIAVLGFALLTSGVRLPAQSLPAVHGSGITSTIPIWMGSAVIGNSVLTQSGNNISLPGILSATGLVCPACVGKPQLSINYAGSSTQGGDASNALKLGGLSPSAFAQVGIPNTFTAGLTVNGSLALNGSINNTLTLQGNLIDSNNDQAANVIGGFGGNGSVPGNSVASGVVGATIAGGGGWYAGMGISVANAVTDNWGTVGGGAANSSGLFATVAGGWTNTASEQDATVAGGANNTASGNSATVAGGGVNTASGILATVAGGSINTASGRYATVPGGNSNVAGGNSSFAAGSYAQALRDGSFVWGDSTGAVVSDTATNQFVARASGGFMFYTAADLSTGAILIPGSGSWSSLSDRNVKANFSVVDGHALLARLMALPVSTWSYKTQPDSIRHMGPMAQDFRAAFGLGEDDKHISTVDAEGVALAAIQALYQTVTELKRDLSDKHHQIVELRARLAHLEQRR